MCVWVGIQLAACQALRTLIDDVNFFEEEFVPFVDPCLRLLLLAMQAVTQLDSQVRGRLHPLLTGHPALLLYTLGLGGAGHSCNSLGWSPSSSTAWGTRSCRVWTNS